MKKTKKKKKHELVQTPIKVYWCRECGYVLLPELDVEIGTATDREHHPSPYKI